MIHLIIETLLYFVLLVVISKLTIFEFSHLLSVYQLFITFVIVVYRQ